jgi:O-antigen ligase
MSPLRAGVIGLRTRTTRSDFRGSRSIRRYLADFGSIEAGFTAFLFSGWYKDLYQPAWFPVDLTLFFFAWTFCLIAAAALAGRIRPFSPGFPALLIVLFSGLALTSLSWSSLDAANLDKVWRFLLLTAPSFLVGQMIAADRERRRRFGLMLIWLTGALLLYYAYCRYGLGLSMQAGGDMGPDNYLEYGSDASILFVLSLTISGFGKPRWLWVALPAAVVAIYLLLVMGGRGPLIEAVAATLLLGTAVRWPPRRLLRRIVFYIGLLAIAGVGYFLFVQTIPTQEANDGSFRTVERLKAQAIGEDTTSMDERKNGRALATQMWLENPLFGAGFGEFAVKDPYLKYPHNLPLEVLSETGAAGGLLFFLTVVLAFYRSKQIIRYRRCEWFDAAIALLCVVKVLLHLTLQGYLADDRIEFALMGLVIGWRASERAVSDTNRRSAVRAARADIALPNPRPSPVAWSPSH